MTPPVVHPLDVSFVLAVTAAAGLGAAITPAGSMLALVVAAGFFALNQWLADRRSEDKA